ncbi:MAG TPA: 2-oxo acid dehydrogenase subunit E2 [Solirubrobacteraceae bacterium]|jgi:pyruvate dehydrogenase E2 component (dihydrolipoamide acetyltransferase)|nr:2-oxo acid dehydrogenase subunit E2 [Solirubrobacteraceae bacterium]
MSEPATPISDRGLKGEITTAELDRHERTLARRSAESRATVPTVEYSNIVDVDALLERELEVGCGVTAAVIAATAHALRTIPRVNGSYRDGRYEFYSRVNVGVTLISEGLHVTPTIFDADAKAAVTIGGELGDFYARARETELHPSELSGATFTVVDSSEYDIVAVTPLILPPQAGALAFGPIRDVPMLRDGDVVPGRTMQLSLAVDHRIVYGHHAAAFLEEVKAFLEEARI